MFCGLTVSSCIDVELSASEWVLYLYPPEGNTIGGLNQQGATEIFSENQNLAGDTPGDYKAVN